MLEIGSSAPDFEAEDSTGGKFRLSSLRGKKVVLYFFPKAFTGGCTIETKQLAALSPKLGEQGVQIVGVSVDEAGTQAKFATHCGASFPIVGDPTKEISRKYGVLSLVGLSKRATFFLDEQGVVQDVVVSLLPNPHLTRTRERYLSSPAA